MPTDRFIDIVFDDGPGHDTGRFVEVENDRGDSIKCGRWVQREGGMWALRLRVKDVARFTSKEPHDG